MKLKKKLSPQYLRVCQWLVLHYLREVVSSTPATANAKRVYRTLAIKNQQDVLRFFEELKNI
jgi:hypothetical protein